MSQIDLDRDRCPSVVQLLAYRPGLDPDRLRFLVVVRCGRRRRAEPIRPRPWSEITGAVEAGWVTNNDPPKLAVLAHGPGPLREPKETGA